MFEVVSEEYKSHELKIYNLVLLYSWINFLSENIDKQ